MTHWGDARRALQADHCVADELHSCVGCEVVVLPSRVDVDWKNACPASRQTEVNVSLPEHTSTKARLRGRPQGTATSGPRGIAAAVAITATPRLRGAPRGTATGGPREAGASPSSSLSACKGFGARPPTARPASPSPPPCARKGCGARPPAARLASPSPSLSARTGCGARPPAARWEARPAPVAEDARPPDERLGGTTSSSDMVTSHRDAMSDRRFAGSKDLSPRSSWRQIPFQPGPTPLQERS